MTPVPISLTTHLQVLYLFLLETINTGFDIGMMYEPLIKRFGNAFRLLQTVT